MNYKNYVFLVSPGDLTSRRIPCNQWCYRLLTRPQDTTAPRPSSTLGYLPLLTNLARWATVYSNVSYDLPPPHYFWHDTPVIK